MTAAVLIIAPVSQAKKDKIKATKIELSAETTKIEVGKTTKLQIKLNKKNEVAVKVSIKSSSAAKLYKTKVKIKKGKQAATVKVTGKKAGTANITASFKNKSNKTYKKSIKIKVFYTEVKLTTPTLSDATYYVGDSNVKALDATLKSFTPDTLTGTTTYQWYEASSNKIQDTDKAIEGATSPTYTPSVSSEGIIYYYCKVSFKPDSNEYKNGEANTNVAAITVKAKQVPPEPYYPSAPPAGPTIRNSNLNNATYDVGQSINVRTLFAETDSIDVSYAWYGSTTGSWSGATPIQGETHQQFTPSTETAGTKYYGVMITDNTTQQTTKSAFACITVLNLTTERNSAENAISEANLAFSTLNGEKSTTNWTTWTTKRDTAESAITTFQNAGGDPASLANYSTFGEDDFHGYRAQAKDIGQYTIKHLSMSGTAHVDINQYSSENAVVQYLISSCSSETPSFQLTIEKLNCTTEQPANFHVSGWSFTCSNFSGPPTVGPSYVFTVDPTFESPYVKATDCGNSTRITVEFHQ